MLTRLRIAKEKRELKLLILIELKQYGVFSKSPEQLGAVAELLKRIK
ncbi:hypothetical protein ACWEWU_10770 [Staphylococcus xylosus]